MKAHERSSLHTQASQALKVFVENASRNAVYTSRGAVVDFIEALGMWVEESILKRLQKASVFSVIADEYTDIMAVEELADECTDIMAVEELADECTDIMAVEELADECTDIMAVEELADECTDIMAVEELADECTDIMAVEEL